MGERRSTHLVFHFPIHYNFSEVTILHLASVEIAHNIYYTELGLQANNTILISPLDLRYWK